MKHVVMFSGGIGSWAAAMRVKETLMPHDELILLFADVGGNHKSIYDGEDADCYRFVHEAAEQLGGQLIILNQGMNIWEVFRKERYLGNTRKSVCSRALKQRPCKKWLKENTTPEESAVYVGIDWSEAHRLVAIRHNYDPWHAEAPLTEPPYLEKQQMMDWAHSVNLDPPEMYEKGYPHANCGGGCVRAGQGQFKLLFENDPERYDWWENNENNLREYLGKDVAILRDRTGGVVRPLTLTEFRARLEETRDPQGFAYDGDLLSLIDVDEIGGCGCFTDESPEDDSRNFSGIE